MRLTKEIKLEAVKFAFEYIRQEDCICQKLAAYLEIKYGIDLDYCQPDYNNLQKEFGLLKYRPKMRFGGDLWFAYTKAGIAKRKTILRKLIKEFSK